MRGSSSDAVLRERYVSLFQHSNDGIFIHDLKGSILDVNDRVVEWLGWSREELLAMTVVDLHPEDDRTVSRAAFETLQKDGQTRFEIRFRTKGGVLRDAEVSASLFAADGDTMVQGIVRDVTERNRIEETLRENERFLRHVFEAIQDGISVLNTDMEILRVNRWMERMYAHCGRLVGRKCYEVYRQRRSPCPDCPTLRALKTGRPEISTVPYITDHEPAGWIELTAFPLTGENGRIEGVIECVKDVTDKKNMEDRLRQSEKMQAIGELAGGIAHDFNNQLAAVVALADLLRSELADTPRLAEYADNILTASRRASELVSQLLAFSRKQRYLTMPVDIHEVIAEVVSLLRRSIDKRISVDTRLQAGAFVTMGDPTQIQNAVLNVALNARDAMPEGGQLVFATDVVTLDEEYCRRNPYEIAPGPCVRISMTDTGAGMDAQTVTRIFEPYFTTKPEGAGTGMGLAAVYGTVKSHGGAVNVYSEVGHGTTFNLYFPLSMETEEDRTAGGEPGPVVTGSAHVLVVEDDDIVRESAGNMLEKLGYRVTACRDGAEAVDYYTDNWRSVDLVILDLIMPRMDGAETFEALRDINPAVAVLVASGYGLNGKGRNVLGKGAAGYLQKPFRIDELSRTVAEILAENGIRSEKRDGRS